MNKPLKSKNIPVTQRALEKVRDELRSLLVKNEAKNEKRFKSVETRLETGFLAAKVDMEEIKSSIHRVLTLVEYQKAENRYVLDGYQSLYDRQERVEKDVEEIKKVLKL